MASFSVLTPAGRGAVATLRVDGMAVLDEPFALFLATNGRSLMQQSIDRVCFGRWGHEAAEDVVACRVSEDVVEIHCHGGDAAVARIVSDLEARGCARVLATTVITGSDSAGGSPSLSRTISGYELIEAECRGALSRATTLRTADILWQQCEGQLASAMTELATLPPERAKRQAAELLRWAEFGRHLTEPWRVVLCGRPNVGKSSLINALVGFGRSIVFDQPGTTLDVVTIETALDGWPVELSDTAGLRESTSELEMAGIERARRRLESADLRVLVIDTSQQADEADRRLLTAWPEAVVVAHKCDLPVMWGAPVPPEALAVSSVTGEGVNLLAELVSGRLVPEVPLPRTLIPVNARQVAQLARVVAATKRECV